MAFKLIKIIGDGTATPAVSNTTNTEAVVNALVAYNTTGSDLDFTILLDGTEVVSETVTANGSFRLVDKLNVPADSDLTINAAVGITVTLSYFQQAIDIAAGLTVVQNLIDTAETELTTATANVASLYNYKGDYNAGTPYAIGDSVIYNNIFFISDVNGNEGNTPADGVNWTSIALSGDILSGATFTGSINESHNTITSVASTVTLDCSTGNAFTHTLTENTTLAFSNLPATGNAYFITFSLVQDASASGYTFTWPATIKWPSATAPTLTATASGEDVFILYTVDGGTTWNGFTAGQALATV